MSETKILSFLIVDDEHDMCTMLKTLIADLYENQGQNCEFTICTSGQQGSEVINSRKFDFIILDLEIPDRHGNALLEDSLCSVFNTETPVLILSGNISSHSWCASDKVVYMEKPMKPERLGRLIKMMTIRKNSLQGAQDFTAYDGAVAELDDDSMWEEFG